MKREPVSERLDRLQGLLAARPSWTAPELATELRVCLRTVRRDLARLQTRGVVLDAQPGRGGGVRAAPRSGLGRVPLTAPEALDLLLALALAESLRSPLLLGGLGPLRQKLSAAFPEAERSRLAQVRRRIRVGPLSANIAASWTPPRAAVSRPLQEAFFTQSLLTLRYRTAAEVTTRTIEPHYLLLTWPAWYVLAWDHLREAPRALRLDRIEAAKVGATPFRLRPFEALSEPLRRLFREL